MKKKTKKILLIILVTVCVIVLSLGIAITVDCSTGGIGGTVVTNVQEGYGQDEWRHYEVDIEFDSACDDKFRTNEKGDYLWHIQMRNMGDDTIRISYFNYFNIADDFEAFFVIRSTLPGREVRTYITPVETTHWIYSDTIDIDFDDLDPEYKNTFDTDYVESYHIVEIWVRTVD